MKKNQTASNQPMIKSVRSTLPIWRVATARSYLRGYDENFPRLGLEVLAVPPYFGFGPESLQGPSKSHTLAVQQPH